MSYSKSEREILTKKLKSEVRKCLKLYGVRKTSVDELVERVNIPKGTFYLFYPSKENLLYEVICEYKRDLYNRFYKTITESNNLSCEYITKILFDIYEEATQSFLVQVEKNHEMELLFRKLPADVVIENEMQMQQLAEKLQDYFSIKSEQNLQEIIGAFKILFFSSLNKNEISEKVYYSSLWLLLNGLTTQIMDRSETNDIHTN